MSKNFFYCIFFLSLFACAQAEVYVYNTTDDRMNYEVVLPNGDTKTGVVAECTGYYPAQTSINTPDGKVSTIRFSDESGGSTVELSASPNRCFLVGKEGGATKIRPISWSLDNGQVQQRQLTLYNGTGSPQTFDLIDEAEMRNITLQPGEEKTVEAKHGFGGSSGFHHLKFADGNRLNNVISSGYYCILYMDKRDPGKVQAANYGHLAMPKGTPVK